MIIIKKYFAKKRKWIRRKVLKWLTIYIGCDFFDLEVIVPLTYQAMVNKGINELLAVIILVLFLTLIAVIVYIFEEWKKAVIDSWKITYKEYLAIKNLR